MKNKGILIATIIFFLLVNTTQLWEGKMGTFAMVTFLIIIIYSLALFIILLGQLLNAFSEKFKVKKRLINIGLLSFVLTTTFIFPQGLINYEVFESANVLIAQREGAANCMTTLKLKENNTYMERSVCFGITETTGEYSVSGDTIFFKSTSRGSDKKEFYEFAIIKKENKTNDGLAEFVRYKNRFDTVGVAFWITKNELFKV